MPTIFLLECNDFINTKVNDYSLKDLIKSAIKNFVERLLEKDVLDPLAIMTIESTPKILCEFTTQYNSLVDSLERYEGGENEWREDDWRVSVKRCMEYCLEVMGDEIPCQAVRLWWGERMWSGECGDDGRLWSAMVGCRVHGVKMGYEKWCLDDGGGVGGSCELFYCCYDPIEALYAKMAELVCECYEYEDLVLTLGHVQTTVVLAPNPRVAFWSVMAAMNGLNLKFPRILSIVGFLPQQYVFSIPCVARFLLLKGKMLQPAKSAPFSSTAIPCNNRYQVTSPLLFLLHNVLQQKKKAAVVYLDDDWYALIQCYSQSGSEGKNVGENTKPTSNSALILAVLEKSAQQEWLGKFSHLLCKSSSQDKTPQKNSRKASLRNHKKNTTSISPKLSTPSILSDHSLSLLDDAVHHQKLLIEDFIKKKEFCNEEKNTESTLELNDDSHELAEKMLQMYQNNSTPIPIPSPENWPSYNPSLDSLDDFVYPLADPISIQVEVLRLSSLVSDLPNSRVAIFKQCERIRILEEQFLLTGLLDTLSFRLISDLNKRASQTLSGKILFHLKSVIQEKIFPIKWLPDDEQRIIIPHNRSKNITEKNSQKSLSTKKKLKLTPDE